MGVGKIVVVINQNGTGAMVIVCEHASNLIPQEFNGLGLDDVSQASHIAWDLGALSVAQVLSDEFDAPLVAPEVSRLVIDCNRHGDAKNAVLESNDGVVIPGNLGLSDDERLERAERYHAPYHNTLTAIIDDALEKGCSPVIVSIHSFVPVYSGAHRDVEIGILFDEDTRFGDALFEVAHTDGAFIVRKNEPYSVKDGVTYTLAKHAVARGLLNVMIEIRNDLIEDAPSQKAVAERLAVFIHGALSTLKSNVQ